jgi:hypothetical protein
MNKIKTAAVLSAVLCLMTGTVLASDSTQTESGSVQPRHDFLFSSSTDMASDNPMDDMYGSSAFIDTFVPSPTGEMIYGQSNEFTPQTTAPEELFTRTREDQYNAIHGSSISPERPLYVTADRMKYVNANGQVEVFGNVDIRHMEDRYQTAYAYGNTVTQKYVVPGEVLWTTPTEYTKADSASYDGTTSTGHFKNIRGWDRGIYYFAGEEGTYHRLENKMVVKKGYFTTKHAIAKVPDYRIEADTIDIYPNDHYTAYNVSLFLKSHRFITLSSYTGSLKDDESDSNLWSLIPTPTYDNDNGFGLKNKIVFPLGGNPDIYAYAKMAWYTDAGFKPDIGIKYNVWPGKFTLRYAKEESSLNDDHVWVKKKPSFSFDSRHFYIPKTNFYTGFDGEVGEWEEGTVDGSHKMWDVYISHDPIHFGPYVTFNWKAGYTRDYYGYNDSIRNNAYYKLGFNAGKGPVSTWVWYTNNNLTGTTPYSFDTYDVEKPLDFGVRLQLTRLDAISVGYEYGTTNHKLEHLDFTYYRDMHSFYGWFMYRQKDHETRFYIQPKDFRF